jgi:hypothetical protein
VFRDCLVPIQSIGHDKEIKVDDSSGIVRAPGLTSVPVVVSAPTFGTTSLYLSVQPLSLLLSTTYRGHLHSSVVLGPGSVIILENVFLRHGQALEASSTLCFLCTRLAIGSRSLTMLVNNVLSAKRMLRYALGCLAISVVGAQVHSGCTTHLIVDSDIFSDVEYVSTVMVTFSTCSRTCHLTCLQQ